MGEEGDDALGKILPESFGSGGGRSKRLSPVAPRKREREKRGEEEERSTRKTVIQARVPASLVPYRVIWASVMLATYRLMWCGLRFQLDT
jgi:hypothetical protein